MAIELVSMQLGKLSSKKSSAMCETLELLRHFDSKHMDESKVLEAALRIDLTDRDLQREHNIQESKRRKAKIRYNDS